MKTEILLTEFRCVCGTRLRVQAEPDPGSSVAKHRFRCSRCDAVRPALGSIIEVSRYQDGEWKRLPPSEWKSASWRGRPTVQR